MKSLENYWSKFDAQNRNNFLPLEPLLGLLLLFLFCCLLLSLRRFLFSLATMPTRPEWPFWVAIHQPLVNCLSQVSSLSAKLNIAPNAGPFGHLELSQSPEEGAAYDSLTQHYSRASSNDPGSVICTPQYSEVCPRLSTPVLKTARVLVQAQQWTFAALRNSPFLCKPLH